IGAGHHEQTLVDAERGDRVAVVGGLCLPALVGRDDEAHDRGRSEPGERVAEEAFVPGHGDEGDLLPRGKRGPGEAEIDGQPAPPLLHPSIRLDPGEGADQCGLAVVDVPGGGDDLHQRTVPSAPGDRRCSRAAATAATSPSSCSAGLQRRSRRQAPPWPVPTTAGAPVRTRAASSCSSAIAQPGTGTPAPPPPPTRPSCATVRPPSRAARASVRARRASEEVRSAARTGGTGPSRVASIAASASLSARTARASGWRAR